MLVAETRRTVSFSQYALTYSMLSEELSTTAQGAGKERDAALGTLRPRTPFLV